MTSLLEAATNNQRAAANPAGSAWVAANAGTGKTRVLTNRVARLLLQGADPAKILCITFTKAAAAEMSDRLFELLGKWSLENDEQLLTDLSELEGPDAPSREVAELSNARRLFARALETPGGLKIQTIHSFCENILKRFPLEAGIAPGFSVMDDVETDRLVETAIDAVGRQSRRDDRLRGAFDRLTATTGPDQLRSILIGLLKSRQTIETGLRQLGSWDAYIAAFGEAIGAPSGKNEDDLIAGFLAKIDTADTERAVAALEFGGVNAVKYAAIFCEATIAKNPDQKWMLLRSALLTLAGAPRKTIADAKAKKQDPWVGDYLDDLKQDCADTMDMIKAVRIASDSRDLMALTRAMHERYAADKAAMAGLDYDDLITRTAALFKDGDAPWVMYKLDNGLEHILVDEAQDTSPGQWDVIEGPLAEFFSGEGAQERGRSFFAVGDQKQSIYSFQGADSGLFSEKEQTLSKKIVAPHRFENFPLTLSFRTTEPVLAFVDELFIEKDAADGLGHFPIPPHGVHREGEAGRVELWPLTPRPEKQDVSPWDAPLDARPQENPARTLCNEIASTIKDWTQSRDLASKGRRINAGDILILVQSRGPLFREAIAALTRHEIQVAGADRLNLADDIAINDLLSYARAVLLHADDLSLAEILKSPFFNYDEDALFALAANREGSLWQALARTRETTIGKSAFDQFTRARNIALNEGAYAFFAHILETGAPSGRERLATRLGPGIHDPIEEFLRQALDYEQKNARSLQGFISYFGQLSVEIKRELEQGGEAVRVMTVHGAKGLEANIVFLLDAHKPPNLTNDSTLQKLHHQGAPILALGGAKERDCPATAAAREQSKLDKYDEHRRLLYVAATRARDELYICGLESGASKDPLSKTVGEQSWHSLAVGAFDRLGVRASSSGETSWGEERRYISSEQTAPPKDDTSASIDQTDIALPAWLCKPAPIEVEGPRLTPSRLTGEHDDLPVYSPRRQADRYRRGKAIHQILELLPGLAPNERSAAADRLLSQHYPEVSDADRANWRDEAVGVLNDEAFAAVFAEGSEAEVSIAGEIEGANGPVLISGQIDRLAVSGDRVLIVDYKTNRPPPASPDGVPQSYLGQLAAYRALLRDVYPDKTVEAALLWTHEARLMAIPSDLLDQAFQRHIAKV